MRARASGGRQPADGRAGDDDDRGRRGEKLWGGGSRYGGRRDADGTDGGVAKRHLDGEIPRNWPNSSMLAPTEGGHVPPHGHIVNAALVPESAASPREAAGFLLAAKAKPRIRGVTLDISLLIPEVLQSKNI